MQPHLRERRSHDVTRLGFAGSRVVAADVGRGMQRETQACRTQLRRVSCGCRADEPQRLYPLPEKLSASRRMSLELQLRLPGLTTAEVRVGPQKKCARVCQCCVVIR